MLEAGAVYGIVRANATEQSNGRYNSICIVPWLVLEAIALVLYIMTIIANHINMSSMCML